MKKLISQLGFTMIELLVVISVIGVLAVAVLSSINPIEQINKGRDTRTRSDAAQLINAVDRFFATQEKYPWNDNNYACGPGAACTTELSATEVDPATAFPLTGSYAEVCEAVDSGVGVGLCQTDSGGGGWMEGLLATSEVKGGFVTRIQAQTTYAIYVYKEDGADSTMYACFLPSSKAFKAEALRNCQDANIVGGWDAVLTAAACPSTDGDAPGGPGYTANEDELICLP